MIEAVRPPTPTRSPGDPDRCAVPLAPQAPTTSPRTGPLSGTTERQRSRPRSGPARPALLRWWRAVPAGWACASMPCSSSACQVCLRRVPLPAGGDHGGGAVVPALWVVVPGRGGAAGWAASPLRPSLAAINALVRCSIPQASNRNACVTRGKSRWHPRGELDQRLGYGMSEHAEALSLVLQRTWCRSRPGRRSALRTGVSRADRLTDTCRRRSLQLSELPAGQLAPGRKLRESRANWSTPGSNSR